MLSTPVLEAASISIDVGRVARGDLQAGDALVARLAVARVGAVDRLRQQARGAGLAGAARAAEEVGVRQPSLAHGVEQRADDRLLADEVGEGLRAPFAVERLRRHVSAPVNWKRLEECDDARETASLSKTREPVPPARVTTNRRLSECDLQRRSQKNSAREAYAIGREEAEERR